jgi:hypothetical protein
VRALVACVVVAVAPGVAGAAEWTRPVDVARKQVGGYVSGAVTPDGRATVLWASRREGAGQVLARDLALDGRLSAPLVVARGRELGGFEAVVAPSGALAVCGYDDDGRPVVAVRPAGAAAWRVQRLAPRSGPFVSSLTCGVDDTGGVVAVWEPDVLAGIVKAVAAPYGAPAQPIGRFRGAGYSDPQLVVAPDGAALLAYGRDDPQPGGGDRGLIVAERLPGAAFGPAVVVDEGAVGGPVANVDPSGTVTLAWTRAEPLALRITTRRVGTEPIMQDIPGIYGPGRILQTGGWTLLTVSAGGSRTRASRPGTVVRAPSQATWPAPVLRPPGLPGSPAASAPDGTVLETWWTGPPGGPRAPTPFGRLRAAVVLPDGTREPAPRMAPRQRGAWHYEGFGSAAGLLLVWTQYEGRSERVERVRLAAYR